LHRDKSFRFGSRLQWWSSVSDVSGALARRARQVLMMMILHNLIRTLPATVLPKAARETWA